MHRTFGYTLRPLLGAVLAACGSDAGAPGAPPESDGEAYYFEARCETCHGQNREGSFLGPSLARIREHWTKAELSSYLLDPEPVVTRDERLTALGRRYPAPMRAFPELDQARREAIAEWLLERAGR